MLELEYQGVKNKGRIMLESTVNENVVMERITINC